MTPFTERSAFDCIDAHFKSLSGRRAELMLDSFESKPARTPFTIASIFGGVAVLANELQKPVALDVETSSHPWAAFALQA
jgi:hypothetical protein